MRPASNSCGRRSCNPRSALATIQVKANQHWRQTFKARSMTPRSVRASELYCHGLRQHFVKFGARLRENRDETLKMPMSTAHLPLEQAGLRLRAPPVPGAKREAHGNPGIPTVGDGFGKWAERADSIACGFRPPPYSVERQPAGNPNVRVSWCDAGCTPG